MIFVRRSNKIWRINLYSGDFSFTEYHLIGFRNQKYIYILFKELIISIQSSSQPSFDLRLTLAIHSTTSIWQINIKEIEKVGLIIPQSSTIRSTFPRSQ